MKNCLVYLLIGMSFNAAVAGEAEDLLKATDRARGGIEQGASWKVQIQSFENGTENSREFDIKAKGDNAIAEATAPAKNKGEVFLFNDRTMWFFKPSLKKPVSISARQKLTGQAANGDIASTNYFRDYSPMVEKEELIDGDKTKVLLLKAKAKNVTYDQIRYWISISKKLAVKAEFLTLQGSVMKVATFEYKNTLIDGGHRFPFVSRMTIVDGKNTSNKSVMTYSVPRVNAHADSIFNINNLSR